MKTCEEITRDLFEKRDEYEREKKRKRKRAAKILSAAAAFAVVATAAVLLVLNRGADAPAVTGEQGEEEPCYVFTPDQAIWADNAEEISTFQNEGLCDWNGKWVTCRLKEALEKAEDDEIFAFSVSPHLDFDFIYNGKTLEEYYLAACEESLYSERLMELLKLGDELKYGDLIWQEGIPGGDRWAKQLYDDTVAFYGKELIDRYIQNGEFLKDKLEDDIETAKNTTVAQDAYNEARSAARAEKAAKLRSVDEKVVIEEYRILFFMPKSYLASLPAEEWAKSVFDLQAKAESGDEAVFAVDEVE